MINTEDYEILKSTFIESQRLFDKLNVVTTNYDNIEFDESGLYQEDEEICQRHWLKLSSKIVDALKKSLVSYNIELHKSNNLAVRELNINLIKDDITSKIKVDFSENDSLNIVQIS